MRYCCTYLCAVGRRVTVGTAGSHISVFDLRKFGDPIEKKESPLKHQTRALATFPDNKGKGDIERGGKRQREGKEDIMIVRCMS